MRMCFSNAASKNSAPSRNPTSTPAGLSADTVASASLSTGTKKRVSSERRNIFWRTLYTVLAWHNNTTVECVERGHKFKTVVSSNLVAQKGSRGRDYFDGTVITCTRKRCEYEEFYGIRVPWKTETPDDKGESNGRKS